MIYVAGGGKPKYEFKIWIIPLVILFAISFISITAWLYSNANKSLKDNFVQQARIVAQALNQEYITSLSGSASDIELAEYQRLEEQLSVIRNATPLCRFIYLLGQLNDESVFFYVDSEPPHSEDYVIPGQSYDEISQDYLAVFNTHVATTVGPVRDRWGVWITALAPIIDKDTGDLLAVLGMDIDASTWNQQVIKDITYESVSTFFILVAFALFFILLLHIRTIRHHQKILFNSEALISATLRSIGDGVITCDCDGKVTGLNTVAEELTGWCSKDAVGHPIDGIFCIMSAKTGLKTQNPVERTLREGIIVDLANHTLLLSKNGNKYHIADSCSPILDESGTIHGAVLVFRNVTDEYKRREELLLIKAAIDSASDAIGMSTPDGLHYYQNESFSKLFGYTTAELITLSPRVLYDKPDEVNDVFRDIMGGKSWQGELTMIANDGRQLTIHLRADCIKDDEGEIIGLIGVHSDITEKKLLEINMLKQARFQEVLLQSTPNPIFAKDISGRYLTCNRAFEEILNIKSSDIVGKTVHEIWPEKYASTYEDRDIELLEQGGNQQYEFKIETAKGDTRDVVFYKTTFEDENGNIAGLIGSMLDITERLNAENLLRESEERLRNISDNLPNGALFQLDFGEDGTDRKFTYLSEGMEKLYGISVSQVMEDASSIYINIFEDDRRRILELEAQSLHAMSMYEAECRIKKPSGEMRWIFTKASPRRNTNKHIIWDGLAFDITDRKLVEETLKENEKLFDLFFSQSLSGFFFMMLEEPIIWNDTIDKEKTLDYVFEHQYMTQVNQAMLNQYGATEDDFLGLTPAEWFKYDLKQARTIWKKLYDEGRCHIETNEQRLDGTPIIIDGDYICLYDDKGRITGFFGVQNDITERKEAEKILHAKTEELERYFTSSLDLLCIANTDGYFIRINPEWQNVLGYTLDELEGKLFIDFVHPDDLDRTLDVVSKLKEQITVLNFENRYRCKDGSYRWIEWRSLPVGNRIYAAARDITDRKIIENALRDSGEQFKVLFLESPVSILIHDKDTGEIVDANTAAYTAYGFSSLDELKAFNFWGESPYSLKEALKWIQKATIEGTQRFEWLSRKASGEIFWEQVCLRPVMLNGVSRVIATTIDITQRKHAEDYVKESELRFRTLFENTPTISVQGYDENRKVIYWNSASENLYGYTKEEAVGRYLEDLIIPDNMRESLVEDINRWLTEGTAIPSGELLLKKADDSPVLVYSSHVMFENHMSGQKEFYCIDIDLTERKLAEEALEDANMQLEFAMIHANEMALQAEVANIAKSEFLANMSHEIRTPMNGVIGMTGLLLETNLDCEQRRYTDHIQTSAESLLSLINDILDFSKIEAGKLELEILDFNLQSILNDITASLAVRAHEKGIEYISTTENNVPVLLEGDTGRIRQILINLLGNAIKFTTEGEVHLHVSLLNETEDNALLRFSVRDTGIGISSDKLDTLFDKFIQVDPSTTRQYGGTGLGLAITKQLIELMDGDISVTSKLGKGSEFSFELKLHKQKDVEQPKVATHAELTGVRTLIVDDNATNSMMLSQCLKSWGMLPLEIHDVDKAFNMLSMAQDDGTPFDLAMIDTQMLGIRSVILAKELMSESQFSDLHIILMTPVGPHKFNEYFEYNRIAGYLTKPIHYDELRDMLLTIFSNNGISSNNTQKSARSALRENQNRFSDCALRVLLAEDNITNQQVALGILKKIGIHADVAADGIEVIKALQMIPYDLVLMDVQMPNMDGYDATKAIRNPKTKIFDPNIPIIAMTAHAMQGDREKCIEAGMDDYISKPVAAQKLVDVLEKWLPSKTEHVINVNNNQPDIKIGSGHTVFDRTAFMNRIVDDHDLAKTLIEYFLEDIPVEIEALSRCIKSGNTTDAQIHAHTIKGTSANVGGDAMRDIALKLEETLKQNDLISASRLFLELETAFEQLKNAMLNEL